MGMHHGVLVHTCISCSLALVWKKTLEDFNVTMDNISLFYYYIESRGKMKRIFTLFVIVYKIEILFFKLLQGFRKCIFLIIM